MDEILKKLSQSGFRKKFKLNKEYKDFVNQKGLETIRQHAEDFISKRIAPSVILNDGKQTPYKSHPVFIAQHATATCCRGCINKWHKLPKNVELTIEQKEYFVNLIMFWIKKEIK